MSTPLDHHVFQHTGPLELKGGSPGPSLEPGILLYNSAAFRRRAGVSATKLEAGLHRLLSTRNN